MKIRNRQTSSRVPSTLLKFDTVYFFEGRIQINSSATLTEVKPDTKLNYAVWADFSLMPGLIIHWPEHSGHSRYSSSWDLPKPSRVAPLCRPVNLAQPRNRSDQRMSACCWVAWQSLKGCKDMRQLLTSHEDSAEPQQQFKSPRAWAAAESSRRQSARRKYSVKGGVKN